MTILKALVALGLKEFRRDSWFVPSILEPRPALHLGSCQAGNKRSEVSLGWR